MEKEKVVELTIKVIVPSAVPSENIRLRLEKELKYTFISCEVEINSETEVENS